MKVILLFTLLIVSSNCLAQDKSDTLLATCCTETGRCSGSAYCTACKNCTGCKHCAKNGGTCGVCSTGKPKRTDKAKQNKNIPLKYSAFTINDILLVSTETLNLREGPSTNYGVVETLHKNDVLVLLGKYELWLQVQVKSSKNIGYVYYKYVE